MANLQKVSIALPIVWIDLIWYIFSMNKDFLNELNGILSIPSISTFSENKVDIKKCVDWIIAYMKKIGLNNVKAYETPGNPIVPTVIDNNLYARGAADDKGQFMIHLFAFSELFKSLGKFPINIKFLIEGEEETGSENLENFIKENKELLNADYALISDSHMISENQPAIDYGLRGLVYFQIDIRTAKQDAHSGIYGGVIRNPLIDISQMISKLKDESGKILIPGIYEKVREIDETERNMLSGQMNEEDVKKEVGVPSTFGEGDFSLAERAGARPSLDVHGIWGGFAKEGSKTVIPSTAGFKVSIRIVPNQTVAEIKEKFEDYIKFICPDGVDMKITYLTGGEPYLLDYRNEVMSLASRTLEKHFGTAPKFLLSGGSIPVTEVLKTNLNIDTILMGFGLPDDNLHAPNEKINLSQIERGIETVKDLFIDLGSKLQAWE